MTTNDTATPFLARHQFLIYRLFSLAGLVPVGAFLVVHLLTNASPTVQWLKDYRAKLANAANALSPTVKFSVATATTQFTNHIAVLEALN